jgi:DNA-binding MarR family transcriptional regulator
MTRPQAASSPTPDQTIRQLLNRRDLAAARHRAAIGHRLGLAHSEMLDVAHLAQSGQLTPSALGELLDLSSGAVTALVQRLEGAGHVVRKPHPTDGRSVLVELAPALVARAGRAFGPLVGDLERVSGELSDAEREVVRRFLARAAALSEAHAERARAELDARAGASATAAPVPGLWG